MDLISEIFGGGPIHPLILNSHGDIIFQKNRGGGSTGGGSYFLDSGSAIASSPDELRLMIQSVTKSAAFFGTFFQSQASI